MNKTYRIVLAGGDRRTHFPLIPVAKEIRAQFGENTELLYFGPAGELEQKIISEAGIASIRILSGKWRRYFDLRNVSDVFRISPDSSSRSTIYTGNMPTRSFQRCLCGGAGCFAAWVYRIPILTQDSDATPGVANRIMGKFADRIAVCISVGNQVLRASEWLLRGIRYAKGFLWVMLTVRVGGSDVRREAGASGAWRELGIASD